MPSTASRSGMAGKMAVHAPVKQIWRLVWPTFRGDDPERLVGLKHIVAMFAFSLLRIWVGANTLTINRDLIQAIHLRDARSFRRLIGLNLVFGLGHSIHRQCLHCTLQCLATAWRRKLTRVLHTKYFKRINYYKLAAVDKIDPDERISEDVKKVTEVMGRVIHNSCSAITTGAYFLPMLVQQSGWFYAFSPFVYLAIAYWASANLGGITPPEIGQLLGELGAKFGVYRTSVMRAKIHGEAICALKGVPLEKEIMLGNFECYMKHQWQYWRRALGYEFLRDLMIGSYRSGGSPGVKVFTSVLATAPILFSTRAQMFQSKSAEASAAAMAKVMFDMDLQYQAFFAATTALNCFRNQQYVSGNARRIVEMMQLLDDCEEAAKSEDETTFVSDSSRIQFDNVDITTPSGNTLVRGLSFRLERNSSMMLTGHNGAGKSSIFRCLGGLWPVSPPGVIRRPGADTMDTAGLNASIYYLPQKPYNVVGTLAEQIAYPDANAASSLDLDNIRVILAQVNLEHLADRENVLKIPTNWQDALSLGEQQRLAIARLIHHKPDFAILDECTSAVPDSVVEVLYRVCRELSITYITISHRPALKRHHEFVLNIGEPTESKWSFRDLRPENMLESRVPVSPRNGDAAQIMSPNQSNVGNNGKYATERSKKYKEEEASRGARAVQDNMSMSRQSDRSKLATFAGVMQTALPRSDGGVQLLGGLFGSVLAQTVLMSTFVKGMGRMKGALVNLDRSRYLVVTGAFVFNGLMLGAINQLTYWLANCLQAKLRVNLTRHLLSRVMKGNTFYHLVHFQRHVQDPEERITVDVRDFAEHVSELFASVAKPLLDASYFSVMLSILLGRRGMSILYGYLIFGIYIVKMFMPNYTEIIRKEKSIESTFKFAHARVSTHAESIAFFGGGDYELANVNRLFDKLTRVNINKNLRQYLQCGIPTQFFTAAHGHAVPDNLQYSMQYLHMMSSDGSSSQLAADDHFVSQSVRTIIEAFSVIIEFSEKFAQLSGVTSRIGQLMQAGEKLETLALQDDSVTSPTTPQPEAGVEQEQAQQIIMMDSIDLVTPAGDCLAKALSVEIDASKPLMITGMNGCGKSSIARVLSGVWPARGGTLSMPDRAKVALVPQRVYSCQGSLADQLSYPVRIQPRDPHTEARMLECLEIVSLGYLGSREKGGLDAVLKWEDTLSLGEQQRIGMARLFFAQPDFAILDEATSAVSQDVEVQLYKAAAKQQMTCITISQRLALPEYHAQELRLGEDTPLGWSLHKTCD